MSTRKSTRLESKPAINFNGLEPDNAMDEDAEFAEENQSDSDHAEGPPSRKRKKTAGGSSRTAAAGQTLKHVKGRRGKLKALPEMPLDILYEIFGHLRPYDILRLARTTKALRGILMQRSAITVWKDARANVEGLPDCPPDLTEPQYARLAFDPFCYLCGAPNVHTVIWACRVRSCQKCINSESFIDSYDVSLRTGDFAYGSLLPYGIAKAGKRSRRAIVVSADFQVILEKVRALENDKASLDKYVRERKEMAVAIESHANLCQAWHRDTSNGRYGQLQDLKERRREAIFTKLRELGYSDELDKHGLYSLRPLTTHALVKKPQELTDRIWSNIKQPLIAILEELKEKRLLAERLITLKKRHNLVRNLLKDYVEKQPFTEVIPGPADVCVMDEFKNIIEDTPEDVEISEETFKPAMERLPHLVAEWRTAKDAELIRITNKDTPDGPQLNESQPKNDHAQLELATTIFQCNSCYGPISYPRILVHSCVHGLRDAWRDPDDPRSKLWRDLDDEPWNFAGDRVSMHRRGKPAARLVVMSCGLDPDTTTTREMDDLDARFECLECYEESYGRLVMGWRTAVSHIMKNHAMVLPKWKRVDEGDTALVKQLEKGRETMNDIRCCARCRHKTYSYGTLMVHLKNEHGLEDISEDDYYRPLDNPQLFDTTRLPALKEDKDSSA